MSRSDRKNIVGIIRKSNFGVSVVNYIKPLVDVRMANSTKGCLQYKFNWKANFL